MNKQQRFLDPAEVANRLGFGVEHVRRLIRLNKWIDAHGGNARAA